MKDKELNYYRDSDLVVTAKDLLNHLTPGDDIIRLWVINPPHKYHAYYCSGTKQTVMEKVVKGLGNKEVKVTMDKDWHTSLLVMSNGEWLPLYIGEHGFNLDIIVDEIRRAYN